jgi:hypothetical protein
VAGLRWRDPQAVGESGQITVFGKGGVAHAKPEDPVFPSRKKGQRLTESAICRCVRIGCGTRTLLMRLIAAHRFISCRPRWAMPASPPPEDICMPDLTARSSVGALL